MKKTAEYVSPMHPDKICDRVSDAILEEITNQDKQARVAVECMGGHGLFVIMGEVTTTAKVDYESVARNYIPKDFEVLVRVVEQSPEIARGVDDGGAGDQGIMVGYATNETESMLPLEYDLAKSLCEYLFEIYPYDGKTQITIDGDRIEVVVASFQHAKQPELITHIKEWLKGRKAVQEPTLLVNPAGDWEIGGFDADVGVTGRKIVVDSYGPHVPVGGGAFSGKDYTKVDRSGAVLAREIAVEQVKNGAKEATVHLAYAIGVKEPVMKEIVS